jgi:hypothetical protein
MSRSARRRRLPGLLVLILVVGVVAGAAWFWTRSWVGSTAGLQGTSAQGDPVQVAVDPPHDRSLDGSGTVTGTSAAGGKVPPSTGAPTRGASPMTSSTGPSTGRRVDVSTTYAEWDRPTGGIVVGGIVSGVIEAGGTCTVTLTGGGASARGTSEGVSDAHDTSCGEVRVPGAGLSSGKWSGVLTYRSAAAAGQSAPFTVVVP